MYFPKSQIQTNLYTNGGEFTTSLSIIPYISYIGYYYKISTGKLYTEKSPTPTSVPLYPIPADNNPNTDWPNSPQDSPKEIQLNYPYNEEYNKSTTSSPLNRKLPLYSPTQPTLQDYTLGSFTRYFCKKTNELKYIEINKETHDKLKNRDPKIAWDLYEPQSIIWQISGDKEQTFLSNRNIIFQLEQRQKWYGFSIYLKEDYLKYYLEN